MLYTVYILECADKTFYTGCTNDIKKRIYAHNNLATGAKYTRGRRPVWLVHRERFRTLAAGRRREAEIKRLTRDQKLELIKYVF